MPTKILHISDLHFGPFYLPQVGEALLNLAEKLALDGIVITGDFTQRAKEEEYVEAKKFIDKLPKIPTLKIPGNHDVPLYRIWERLSSPHLFYKKYIENSLDVKLSFPQAVIVGLDSTAPLTATVNGRIRDYQIDFAKQAFENEKTRIGDAGFFAVAAHHHFVPAPDFELSVPLPKAKEALNKFQKMNVEMIFGGHLHRSYIGNSLDVYPGEKKERGIIIILCGTSTSRRGRGPERERNSCNFVTVNDDRITVVHYLYFDADKSFYPVSEHIFARNRVQVLS